MSGKAGLEALKLKISEKERQIEELKLKNLALMEQTDDLIDSMDIATVQIKELTSEAAEISRNKKVLAEMSNSVESKSLQIVQEYQELQTQTRQCSANQTNLKKAASMLRSAIQEVGRKQHEELKRFDEQTPRLKEDLQNIKAKNQAKLNNLQMRKRLLSSKLESTKSSYDLLSSEVVELSKIGDELSSKEY
uniref:Uncharacterized protein n=1 Tax=Ciona savignyi TaxID=51511 RepID=H2YD88_CIOSA